MDKMASKRAPLDDRAREIVYNVLRYMRKEAMDCRTRVFEKEYFYKIQKRTAEATGVSLKTIQSILDQAALTATVSGRVNFSVSKKRGNSKRDDVVLDKKYYEIIQKIIRGYVDTNNRYPSLRYVLTKLKKFIIIPLGIRSLQKIVHEMGYIYSKHAIIGVDTQNIKRDLNGSPKPDNGSDALQIKDEIIEDELPSSSVPKHTTMESSVELPDIPFTKESIITKMEVIEDTTD